MFGSIARSKLKTLGVSGLIYALSVDTGVFGSARQGFIASAAHTIVVGGEKARDLVRQSSKRQSTRDGQRIVRHFDTRVVHLSRSLIERQMSSWLLGMQQRHRYRELWKKICLISGQTLTLGVSFANRYISVEKFEAHY